MTKQFKATAIGVCVCAMLLTTTGCLIGGKTVWAEKSETVTVKATEWADNTERQSLEAAGITTLNVRTHNGRLEAIGDADDQAITIVAAKKGGSRTLAGAEEALDAIEVFVEDAENGTRSVGWRWKVTKQKHWRASVSFDIILPKHLALDLKTHNGRIDVAYLEGDLRAVSHNGRLIFRGLAGNVYGETHNGRITAECAGEDIILITHNGSVRADLRECAAPAGSIATYNGQVEVILDDSASTRITGVTHNGRITCQVPTIAITNSKKKLKATMGDGRGRLNISTRNGSIRIW